MSSETRGFPSFMPMPHSPRIILLTGATRGGGRALVDRFVEAGHTVHGCGRSSETIAALTEQYPAPHSFSALDVSDETTVSAWARALLSDNIIPDLLINNASVMNRQAPLWELSAEEFNELMAINVSGVANTIRAFVPAMIARGAGTIVNFSSGWGHSTSPKVGPYCASKHAVEGLSGSLSKELPVGLACVAFAPGLIATDMLRKCLPESALSADAPEAWSRRAAPFLLNLGVDDNGRSLRLS
ncbi:MAG: NAD(P)-dependent dehydrogenase (short-subunit alcohol dehydrogenase family) [Pseudohongiellaceae bacterium]|jgi:NAD(P)-dependent dehydrogenase (short-subunit alcohol dehydrogenase family)